MKLFLPQILWSMSMSPRPDSKRPLPAPERVVFPPKPLQNGTAYSAPALRTLSQIERGVR